eukprot:TRINITY_DN2205_c0_g4_i1.p1 TRINITY_DN2205_c0_g4~~TRINITY_DN2205_c0_g4_i1.p1  ORF type:complete len:270 (+),score=33.06 TRINITY_DN2205_c0_g4_i1:49-810(+)
MCIRDRYMGIIELDQRSGKPYKEKLLLYHMLIVTHEFPSGFSKAEHQVREFGTHCNDIQSHVSESSISSLPEVSASNRSSLPVVPRQETEDVDETMLIESIGEIVDDLVESSYESSTAPRTVFHCRSLPRISVIDYIKRIWKHSKNSVSCYIVALMYIDQLQHVVPNFALDSMNVHRLLLTSILLATKFLEDIFYNNEYFASVGGVDLEDLNTMEAQMFCLLSMNCSVSDEKFLQYHDELISYTRNAHGHNTN